MSYTFATIFPLKKCHSNNRTHNTTIIPQWFSLLKTLFRGECFTIFANFIIIKNVVNYYESSYANKDKITINILKLKKNVYSYHNVLDNNKNFVSPDTQLV